jgi:hypothetical protein
MVLLVVVLDQTVDCITEREREREREKLHTVKGMSCFQAHRWYLALIGEPARLLSSKQDRHTV